MPNWPSAVTKILALLLCLAAAAPVSAVEPPGEVSVREARLLRQNDQYALDAEIDYPLPPAVREALSNGVAIAWVVQLKLKRARRLLWDETVLNERVYYRMRYHALSKLYQVRQDSTGTPRYFATLDAAVQALGRIRQLNIAPAGRILLGVPYQASLRAYLDFEALPLPLRSVAYLQPQWHLDSAWYRWTFAE